MNPAAVKTEPAPLSESSFGLTLDAVLDALRDGPVFPSNFEEAKVAIGMLNKEEKLDFGAKNSELSLSYLHSDKTDISIVVCTGLGEPTEPLRPLLEKLHGLGCNVFAPAIPMHYAGATIGDLSVKNLLWRTQETADIGAALGHRVVFCGASTGSLMSMAGASLLDRAGVDSQIVVMAPATVFSGFPEYGIPVMPKAIIRLLVHIAAARPDSERLLSFLDMRAAGGSRKALASVIEFRHEAELLVSQTLPHLKGADVYFDPNDPHMSIGSGKVAVEWLLHATHDVTLETCSFPLHSKHPNPKEKSWDKEYAIVLAQVEREVGAIIQNMRVG